MLWATPLLASEAELEIPVLTEGQNTVLMIGLLICALGMAFGAYEYVKVKKFPAHKSMLDVADIIFQTCKTYLIQQGKLLIILEIFIGICIAYYFGFLQHTPVEGVLIILAWSVVGILGSYGVAWFGIRMNTLANSRMAFASLEGKPIKLLDIPLRAGMSIGVLLVCVELIMMLIILVFMPRQYAGACFIGFAIGESLGASALRICGGIFTKIADIGSDLMKIVFNIKEDDPRNPGVIADCTGDNAGDSVGPTADGFETYGVTGVALISFIVLGVFPQFQAELITWIFVMRILMIVTSIVAYLINKGVTTSMFAGKEKIDFELPLTMLVWFTSILSIIVTFAVSYWQIGHLPNNLWFTLSIIISCGTLAAALIPELVKVFTSSKSLHCREVVTSAREGGASLGILSGFVAGNFSAFWIGMAIFGLMFIAYLASLSGLDKFMEYSSIFAFGLVAFGFLGMGPVTIAVDSYGPVTDNAQSIYELSLIETIPNVAQEIKKNFGFQPNFETAKHYLEENDSCGNTFKATAKPVLIGTAVVGATTMIFSLILLLRKELGIQPETILNLLNPYTLLGFLCGGAVIYWFTGASMQAVTTGAYRAVQYIKRNIKLDDTATLSASTETSKEVVKICTQYAQKGMFNIFIVIFCFALAFAFFSAPGTSNAPASFFISYLIAIAVFGLFQAIFMANAGGCWDNAKKVVEVDLKEKGTPLHAATVIGDTVGDPFKDTSSVAMNPIIKFTTLFGILAMEIAISPGMKAVAHYVGAVFFVISLIFVARSFYGMRIPKE
ncbi:MAG: sodium-translocating pyrophosphatase [Deltaproteobacteria bacterium]|nr:sodium-translocating pyrophosphatase [Deltaproteobacteria bacterium]